MATITDNRDGTLTVACTEQERETLAGLPPDQLASYVTLWIEGRSGQVLATRVARLPQTDHDDLIVKLRQYDPVKTVEET